MVMKQASHGEQESKWDPMLVIAVVILAVAFIALLVIAIGPAHHFQ
jgi:uncharacterized protein YabE (DUF348 family)